MTTKTLKEEYIAFDKRITFIIGYRNLYAFCVAMIGAMCLYYGDVLSSSNYYMLSMILFVLSGKWFLDQMFENIDATYVQDVLTDGGR
jgi:hypothetical protein